MEKEYKDYIRELGFEVIDFKDTCFKASDGNSLVTIKLGFGIDPWAYTHVTRENEVLERVRGIKGIVEKISFHEFEDPKVVALVRRYIEGTELLGYCSSDWLANKKVLVNAVETLHENGITRLDLETRNIIIDPTKKPHIIDLGYCSFADEIGKENFERRKRQDLTDLERIIGR